MTASFLVPTVTALTADGELDRAGNLAVVDHCLAGGVDGLVVLGSTGEFPSLSTEAKRELVELSVERVAGRAEVIVGTAGMRLEETVENSRHALAAGADAVMVVGPWYFGLEDAAVEAWFDAVAGRVDGPVYLYNFPARTGYDVSPAVTARLAARHPNIVGYKDTVVELGHTRALLTQVLPVRPDFRVLAGFDENLAHVVASGAAGAIGALGNVFPEACARYADAVRSGDAARIATTQRVIDRLMGLYAIGSPFIPVLKKAMALRGVAIGEHSAFPHLPTTPDQDARIVRLLAEVEELLG